jgi:hypothetical protein
LHLGWSPGLRFDDALAWTVEWYHAFYSDSGSAAKLTENQIEKYMKMA